MFQKSFQSVLISLFGIFLFTGVARAQVGFLPISADYAAFQNSDSAAYVEFYFSFSQGSLDYENVNDTLSAVFQTNLTVMDGKKILKNITHKFSSHVPDSSKFNRYNQFYDIFKLNIKPGKYKAIARLQDKNSGMRGEYVLDLRIKPASKRLAVSDIQLASAISRTNDQNGRYVKNGLTVIPNARKSCDMLTPMLYYYVEISNLMRTAGSNYNFNFSVVDENGKTVKKGPLRSKDIIANSQAEVGGFNAMSLPEGRYSLVVRASVGDDTTGVISKKSFLVYKPNKKKDNTVSNNSRNNIESAFLTMTGDDIKKELLIAKYLANPEEAKSIDALDSTKALRIFITQFWKNQDKVHEVKPGESRRIFLDRVNEANARFRHMGKPGWKSDRGRVLIVYGRPDEIDRNSNNMGSKPYVIWRYNQLYGGVEFVFVDRNGFGTYELVHSTYYKEIQNPDWQKEYGNTFSPR